MPPLGPVEKGGGDERVVVVVVVVCLGSTPAALRLKAGTWRSLPLGLLPTGGSARHLVATAKADIETRHNGNNGH
ncbi:unnamed protein product [Lampetra fluviatilis]